MFDHCLPPEPTEDDKSISIWLQPSPLIIEGIDITTDGINGFFGGWIKTYDDDDEIFKGCQVLQIVLNDGKHAALILVWISWIFVPITRAMVESLLSKLLG